MSNMAHHYYQIITQGHYFRFYHSIQAFGGFYPQTPRWGRKRRPQTPERISFSVGCLQTAADIFVII